MGEPLHELEAKVELLSQRVEQIERQLEGQAAAASPAAEPASQEVPPTPNAVAPWIPLLGRTCLVLGAGFLLRALTDARLLPLGVGVALGLGLAAGAMLFALRASRSAQAASAGFHGSAAALIGYPLAYEAAMRMGALPVGAAVLVMGALTSALLFIGWRYQQRFLAWEAVLAGLAGATAFLLFSDSQSVAVLLCLLCAASLAVATSRSWLGLPWLPALWANVVVLRALFRAEYDPRATPEWMLPALGSALLLVACSVWPLFHRALGQSRPLGVFEAIQATLALAIGLLVSASVAHPLGRSMAGVALAAALVGAAAVGVGLFILPRRGASALERSLYDGLGFSLLGAASALAADGRLRGVLLAAVCLAATLGGRWLKDAPLAWFAAVLGVAAAASARLWAPSWEGTAAVGLLFGAYEAMTARGRESPRLPASALLLLSALSAAALLAEACRIALGSRAEDAALVASARTLALVVVATALAVSRRLVDRGEVGWIAYAVLGLTGVKVLAEDLPRGRAATLVFSFVLYGGALVLLPRLVRVSRRTPRTQTGA